MRTFSVTLIGLVAVLIAISAVIRGQQPAAPPPLVAVRPIAPPDKPLPSEAASAGVTRFSFIAYGDTRCSCSAQAPSEVQREHSLVADSIVAKIKALAATTDPIRFIIQSGDAVWRGQDGERWNDVFTPIVEKLTRGAGVPYLFAVGNHDVTPLPPGSPDRALGLHNTLTAISKLIPPEGSPRRLSGYPTYAFGYGNAFFIAIDSNIASDTVQLAWVSDQLEHLNRTRYRHVIVFFHHPIFSSGPHGAASVEPPTQALRTLYAPLFRKYHVRMTVTGHDHLHDHWVERYVDNGTTYRMDDLVTGSGGAPIYVYSGEPDLQTYLAAGAEQKVRVEHLRKPGATQAENPHHFVVIQVDGDRLSLEVFGTGPTPFTPYNGRSRTELNDRLN